MNRSPKPTFAIVLGVVLCAAQARSPHRASGLPRPRHPRRPAETASLKDGYTATEMSRGFEARHNRGVNVGFLDGHARWLPLRELCREDEDRQGFYWFHYAAADR
jgi:prepilin-type processing-associated H-X9-DG protein